jgi:dihydroorotase
MAESVLFAGGTVVDVDGERRIDVRIDPVSGRVVEAGADLEVVGSEVHDVSGAYVLPGLVDVHVHMRQPGREEAETVETGARCAALGGYTAVVAMPNTTPAIDCAAVVREVLELGRTAPCDVHSSGAVTIDRAGETLAPMAEMAALGVRLFTDDGAGVQDPGLMRRAMEYAADLGVTLAQHCEVDALAAGGHMHEGEWSSRLGIPGQPAEAEEMMVARDLMLARLTGARIHIQHVSTATSVAMVRAAKAEGLPVTAEATTHHFTLTHAECASYSPLFKVAPPLRTDADVEAIRAGLADGTIDAVATDHAPHTLESKELPFEQAPPGMLGLETALALAIGHLDLPMVDVVRRMSLAPAAIAGVADVHGRPVAAGEFANLCVLDPGATWTVDPAVTASRSRNTPYGGWTLQGKVIHTVLHGEMVVRGGEALR